MGVNRDPLRIRKVNGRWWVYTHVRHDDEYVLKEIFDSQAEAMDFARGKLAKWRAIRDSYMAEPPLRPLSEMFEHKKAWDKRHHLSGRVKFWARVNSTVWLPALGVLLMALIASALIVFLWPHQPDSVLPSNIYTPFTKVPQPSRPPHPLSVYVPPGYEGK